MATATLADVDLTPAWIDLIVTHASLASVDAFYQNSGAGAIALVFGGAAAPTDKSGVVLGPRDSFQGNAAHIWARSIDANGRVAPTLI